MWRSQISPPRALCLVRVHRRHMNASGTYATALSTSQVLQHMLALLAIAFGKDTATATIISLEPFFEALPEDKCSPSSHPEGSAAPPPSSPAPKSAGGEGRVDVNGMIEQAQQGVDCRTGEMRTLPVHAKTAWAPFRNAEAKDGIAGPGTKNDTAGATYLCRWLESGFLLGGGWTRSVDQGSSRRKRRRRLSSIVLPFVPLTDADAEAVEKRDTINTAARLGCAVGNLSKRQRTMLVAKVRRMRYACTSSQPKLGNCVSSSSTPRAPGGNPQMPWRNHTFDDARRCVPPTSSGNRQSRGSISASRRQGLYV